MFCYIRFRYIQKQIKLFVVLFIIPQDYEFQCLVKYQINIFFLKIITTNGLIFSKIVNYSMEIIKRISGYTILSIITSAISFLFLPLLTKYLSPVDYGVLSIFNASVNFLTALIPLGMNHILLVQLVKNKLEYPKQFVSFIKITSSITFSISILVGIFSFYISIFFGLPFILTIFLPVIALMIVYYDVIINYFVFVKQFANYAKFTLSKFFIEYFFVVLLIVVFPFSWRGRILALLISLIIILILGFLLFFKKKILSFNLQKTKTYKSHIKEGLPLTLMGLSIMIINLSDRFFIEHFVGLNDTGLYGISSTIAGILLMIIGSTMNVIRPLIYEHLSTGKNELINLTISYVVGLLLATISLLFLVPFIYKYMINESYSQSILYCYPLIIGLFFWGIYNYVISFYLYKKKTNFIGIISLIGVLINLILNYFLTLTYGAIGAAYATLLTYLTISLIISLTYLFLHKDIK